MKMKLVSLLVLLIPKAILCFKDLKVSEKVLDNINIEDILIDNY